MEQRNVDGYVRSESELSYVPAIRLDRGGAQFYVYRDVEWDRRLLDFNAFEYGDYAGRFDVAIPILPGSDFSLF